MQPLYYFNVKPALRSENLDDDKEFEENLMKK